MGPKTAEHTQELEPFHGLDEQLTHQLATFELFFKTVGFKRIHGRMWGFLILAGRPLSSREISTHLGLSQGATSTCLNELTEWGAVNSEFDVARRCHLHSPVSNTMSIVATVLRRREQVVFGKFKRGAAQTMEYVSNRYGERDPRVLSLRSIITSLEIAEGVMQLVFSSVERALGDGEGILARAVNTALRIGLTVPGRLISGKRADTQEGAAEEDQIDSLDDTGLDVTGLDETESDTESDVVSDAASDAGEAWQEEEPSPTAQRVSEADD